MVKLKDYPFLILILISSFLVFISAYFTCIQGDEGFYLYAMKTVKGPETLYEDVNYCQFPGFPVIFSGISEIFGDNFYHLRLFSGLFGIASYIIGYLCCLHLGVSKRGLWIYALAIALNSYMAYFLTIIRPISITTFFCSLSLYLMLTESYKTQRGVFMILLFGWMAVWARLTAFPLIIIFHLFLIYYYLNNPSSTLTLTPPNPLFIKEGGKGGVKVGLSILVSVAAGLALFGYYLIVTPERFIFNNLTAHTLLYEGFYKSFADQIISKLRHLIGLSDKFPAIILLLILLLAQFKEALKRLFNHPKREPLLLVIAAISALFLIHLFPHRILREHFIVIIPVSAALILYGIDRLYPKFNKYVVILLGILIALQFFSAYRRIPQFARENSLEKLTIQKMLDISEKVSNYSKQGDQIITPEPEVAYYSRRDVIRGLGSGCFGCRANMSDAEAVEYGYLNKNLLLRFLDNPTVAVVCFEKGHWFFGEWFIEKLQENFELRDSIPYRDTSKPYLIFVRR